MKIGLRAGHSDNCEGAVGIVNEHEQMKKYYSAVKTVFEKYGHTVIDCNSNASTENGELSEGVYKANSNNVDLFISLHMNAFDGTGHGTECLVSSAKSTAFPYAQRLASNYAELGFTNRGVKFVKAYEMNHIKCGNIISEICFCDSTEDIEIYNRYSWDKLAHVLCNAIDPSIPKDPVNDTPSNKYVVSKYLPSAYAGYDGVNMKPIADLLGDVRFYVKHDNNGVWIETQYLNDEQCEQVKNKLGSLFYKIEK